LKNKYITRYISNILSKNTKNMPVGPFGTNSNCGCGTICMLLGTLCCDFLVEVFTCNFCCGACNKNNDNREKEPLHK
jgi:hypothetical protein